MGFCLFAPKGNPVDIPERDGARRRRSELGATGAGTGKSDLFLLTLRAHGSSLAGEVGGAAEEQHMCCLGSMRRAVKIQGKRSMAAY